MVDNKEIIKEAIVHLDRAINSIDLIIKECEKNKRLIESWLERTPIEKD